MINVQGLCTFPKNERFTALCVVVVRALRNKSYFICERAKLTHIITQQKDITEIFPTTLIKYKIEHQNKINQSRAEGHRREQKDSTL